MLVLPHPLRHSTERHPLFAESHPAFTEAAMAESIDRIRRALGISTAARPGSPRRQRHERSYSNTRLAAPWVNNGSTTSVPTAVAFRTRLAGHRTLVAPLVEGAISAGEATPVAEEVTDDFVFVLEFQSP